MAGGWPGSSQHPSSPALSPCHIKHIHTWVGSPFLPTGGAVRPAPSPLPASGSSGCAPEPTHAHTHVPGTPHVHIPHARTRQVRSVTWDCSSPTRAVSSEMFPSSTFSFVSGRLYYRLLRDVTGNISHVAPRRASGHPFPPHGAPWGHLWTGHTSTPSSLGTSPSPEASESLARRPSWLLPPALLIGAVCYVEMEMRHLLSERCCQGNPSKEGPRTFQSSWGSVLIRTQRAATTKACRWPPDGPAAF